MRASVAGLLGVLCFLTGFSVITQDRVARESKRADTASRLSATYQDARHWVTEAKSVERRYRFEGSESVRLSHEQATERLEADLRSVMRLDPSPAARETVDRLLYLEARYVAASAGLFSAIDVGDDPGIQHLDHEVIDPIFGVLEYMIHQQARVASAKALEHSASLREHLARASRMIAIAFAVGIALLAGFALILVRFRRRLDAAQAGEVARLAQIAITDPLTGLRNHRAFQEDLARELQRVGRTGVPLALVLLDLDGLKAINDNLGHQAGDERLQATAAAIRTSQRATDLAYRIGGDEFAVILPSARALGALEFAQRVRAAVPRHGGHRGGHHAARQGRPDPRGRPGADRRQADPPGRRRLRAGHGARQERPHVRGRAPRAHARERARAGGRREGLLHPQPLPDGLAAVRDDRDRARRRRRAARPHPARRPAARRRQDRRARRDPQQAGRADGRRVRADEAPLAARLRHRRGRRHAGRGALGPPPPRALRRHRLPGPPGRRARSRSSRGSSSSPTRSRR